jgi:hypothetical protein
VTSGALLRKTVFACAAFAVALAGGLSMAGHPVEGISLGVGMMLGSANGYLLQGLMGRGTPFVASSLLRIVLFSSVVLMVAFAARDSAWAVALGIGLAQLVLVGVGVREGLRRR